MMTNENGPQNEEEIFTEESDNKSKFITMTDGSFYHRYESSDFQANDSDLESDELDEDPFQQSFASIHDNETSTGNQENQLEDLQEQLMLVILEKQQLAQELKKVKEDQVQSLADQLKVEQEKNKQLTNKINEKPKRRKFIRTKKTDNNLFKSKSLTSLNQNDNNLTFDLEAMEEENEEEEDSTDKRKERGAVNQTLLNAPQPQRIPTATFLPWVLTAQEWLESWMETVKEDFSEVSDLPEVDDDPFGEPLNILKLQRNLIRSGNLLDPLTDLTTDFTSIYLWDRPVLTFLIFMVYMYSVYQGLIVTFSLALLTFLFIYAYMRQKNWNANSEIGGKIDAKEVEMSIGVRDKIAIMLQVSRRAQNLSGQLCDIGEKLKNLLLWKQPELTKQALAVLVLGLVASFFLSQTALLTLAGFGIGIRIFIIEYIFCRFPRVRQKYDLVAQVYNELMSDVELQKMLKHQALYHKRKGAVWTGSLPNLSTSTPNLSRYSSEQSLVSEASTSSSSFSEIFQLPSTETPLALWQNGRKCTIINKDKPITSTFRVGKMYLTNNHLCFERFKHSSPKNLSIPLESITKLDKAKLYSWLPGGGKALEVRVKGFSKRLFFVFQSQLFGTIANRDEAFDSIMSIGRKNNHQWAR